MTNKLTDEINLHDNYAKSYIDYCKNDKITTFGTINTQPYDDYTKVILNNAYGATNLYVPGKLEIKKVITMHQIKLFLKESFGNGYSVILKTKVKDSKKTEITITRKKIRL